MKSLSTELLDRLEAFIVAREHAKIEKHVALLIDERDQLSAQLLEARERISDFEDSGAKNATERTLLAKLKEVLRKVSGLNEAGGIDQQLDLIEKGWLSSMVHVQDARHALARVTAERDRLQRALDTANSGRVRERRSAKK